MSNGSLEMSIKDGNSFDDTSNEFVVRAYNNSDKRDHANEYAPISLLSVNIFHIFSLMVLYIQIS